MEKLTLNNQIILCRPAVKRAKVCIIRKKIKKLKLLQTCKKEVDKEKKLKKAERIMEEIQIMKKVREDDVTKFALLNKDVMSIITKTTSNDHDHVYATLASHPDVQKKIEETRQLFPCWEKTLPSLLESLGLRTMMKKSKIKSLPAGLTNNESKKEVEDKTADSESNKVHKGNPEDKKVGRTKKKVKLEETLLQKEEEKDEELVVENNETVKVVDSFFVNKKVIQPKLLSTETIKQEKEELTKNEADQHYYTTNLRNLSRQEGFAKPSTEHAFFKHKKNPPTAVGRPDRSSGGPAIKEQVEEKLHPSWAAKKAQTIKPFLGKKIKFDD